MIHHLEHFVQTASLGENIYERLVIVERLAHLLQRVLGNEEQRLRPHHLQISLVKNIREKIRLVLQPRAQALDELPVFLRILALDDGHQIILRRKFLPKREVVLVILLLGTHQIIATRVELKRRDRVVKRQPQQNHLGQDERLRILRDRASEPRETPDGDAGFRRFHRVKTGPA